MPSALVTLINFGDLPTANESAINMLNEILKAYRNGDTANAIVALEEFLDRVKCSDD